jgi:hypothetical protein
MMFDAERVRANVRQATTEDLLDRATVYAEGMEPEALDIIETELRRRGVTWADQKAHAERHQAQSRLAGEGSPPRCRYCPRAAVVRAWGWHWLPGFLPGFPLPWLYYYCEAHAPRRGERADGGR